MDQKTQFIEATLDWAENRMEGLLNEGHIPDALALGQEFHEWMRAPLGFDHDLDFPTVDS
jgi:hypothetical protein